MQEARDQQYKEMRKTIQNENSEKKKQTNKKSQLDPLRTENLNQ